ncbi:putative membrane protein [Streptomyces ambofaciens ATCC 23877]|uniref:DUF4190 domain-containing protein n=2 Tax=Streptomyces ambofaciens TaxID=1889 RepID=A0ABN4PK86_STRAM|nr:DUF4190 domain-containing protein [Streptomyces ambofaciens]AKZ60184.1 putative membrane protein [Streptomyces ambofaciens ATCC 23877]ANB10393.1 hypothetical protein SAM40697_6440 [Streptomyces ambofaciens]CAJ88162.1 putative membrane protein [Streptomyces ambofaciens ATCC 23877]
MATYSRTSAHKSSRTSGLAIAGLVCGIVGLFLLPIILGPLAIIFGAVAMRQTGSAMAKWAIGLGIVDIILMIVMFTVAANNGGSFTWTVG